MTRGRGRDRDFGRVFIFSGCHFYHLKNQSLFGGLQCLRAGLVISVVVQECTESSPNIALASEKWHCEAGTALKSRIRRASILIISVNLYRELTIVSH